MDCFRRMDRESIVKKLRTGGIGVTGPRIAILDYLMEHHTHPSVDTIFGDVRKSFPNLSRTTVYNTVKILSEKGLAQMITIDGEHVSIDGDMSPHAHLLCRRCGRIVDIPLLGVSGEDAGGTFMVGGNRVEEIHHYYKGICQECLTRQNK